MNILEGQRHEPSIALGGIDFVIVLDFSRALQGSGN
jgi:hypothetical protein